MSARDPQPGDRFVFRWRGNVVEPSYERIDGREIEVVRICKSIPAVEFALAEEDRKSFGLAWLDELADKPEPRA